MPVVPMAEVVAVQPLSPHTVTCDGPAWGTAARPGDRLGLITSTTEDAR